MTPHNSKLQTLGQRGAALVVVLVVLMALVVIATPFAASMRLQEHTAKNQAKALEANDLGQSVRNYVVMRLGQLTSRAQDTTPFWDSRTEWDPEQIELTADALGYSEALDMEGRGIDSLNDPKGYVVSVEIEDEQSKLNVNSASALALGSIIGAGLCTEPLAEDSDEIVLDDASRFYSDGKPSTTDGYVWVGGELIGYRHVAGNKLVGLERGVIGDDIEFNSATSHGRWSLVVDARAYFLVRHRVNPERAQAGGARYQLMQSLSEIRTVIEQEIGTELPALRGFTHEELEALRPLLTVHSSRDTRVGFAGSRRVIRIIQEDGRPDRLQVLDASLIALGSIVRISAPDLEPEYAIVKQRRWGGMLTLDRELQNEYPADQAVVEAEIRHPVNVNTAPPAVIIASLVGLRTWWDREPRNKANSDSASGENTGNTITVEEATALALRIADYEGEKGHPIRHYQDFRDMIEEAIEAGEITDKDRASILLNARNSNDPRLMAATVPFIYHSNDVFTLETSAVVNSPAGIPLATYRVREVVEIAAPRQAALPFDSQYEFQRELWRGLGYKVDSHPRYEQVWDRTGLPEYFPEMDADSPEQGWLMPMASEIHTCQGSNIQVNRRSVRRMSDHFDLGWRDGFLANALYTQFEPRPDGLIITSSGITTPAKTQQIVLDPDNAEKDIRAGQVEFWFKPNWTNRGDDHFLVDFGEAAGMEFENRITLFYDGEEQELVLRCADATLDQAAAEVRYPVNSTRFRNDTWYHISGFWYGTGLGELAMMIDGQAVGRFEHRNDDGDTFITKLSSDIGPEDATIPVEDTEGFPDEGVLLIGAEAVLFTSTSGGTFEFEPYTEFQLEPDPPDPNGPITPLWMRTGRGARGTTPMAHSQGTPVVVWGYSTDTQEDYPTDGLGIRAGGASISEGGFGDDTSTNMVLPGTGGSASTGTSDPGSGSDPDDGNDGNSGIVIPNFLLQAAPIPIALTTSGSEFDVGTTEEFPDSGFLILYYRGPDPAGAAAPGPGPGPAPGPGGGGDGDSGIFMPQEAPEVERYEFVYYKSKDDAQFKDLDRALFDTTAQEFPIGTLVFLVSVPSDTPAVDVYAPGGWIQVNNEWFRYDQIEMWNGKWYFVKTSGITQELGDFEPEEEEEGGEGGGTIPEGGRAGKGGGGGGGGGGGTDGIWQDDGSGSGEGGGGGGGEGTGEGTGEGGGGSSSSQNAANAFTFRARARTVLAEHAPGDKIIPVGRFKRPVGGRHDVVTVLHKGASGDTREAMLIHWSAIVAEPDFTKIPPGSGSGGGSEEGGGFKLPPGTSRGGKGSSGGGGGGGGGGSDQMWQEGFEEEGNGEGEGEPEFSPPADPTLSVSGDFWFLVAFTDFVQSAPGNGYPAEETRVLKFPSGELPARISNDISLFQSMDGSVTSGQLDEVRFSVYGRRRLTVYSGNDYDAQADRITLSTPVNGEGPGVVAYAGTEENPVSWPTWLTPTTLPTDGGILRMGHEFVGYRRHSQEGWVLHLEECERGMFNSEPDVIPAGSTVMLLYYLDVSTTQQGGTPFSSNIALNDIKGFPGEGYAMINNEIVGYTRIDRGLGMVMPIKQDDSSGLFRGAFGTEPDAFDAGDLVLGLPFRYFDRYQELADAPEMGQGTLLFQAKDAFFTGLRWEAQIPDPQYQAVRLLARVDGRPAWNSEPTNEAGGLYEFTDPNELGVLGLQGDTIEVRVYFEWKSDAFRIEGSDIETQHTTPYWKDTGRLLRLEIEYREPVVVRHREELVR